MMTFCMQVFFVESICDDPEIIAENIKVSQEMCFFFVCYVSVCRGGTDVVFAIKFPNALSFTASKIWESRLRGS